MATYYDPYEKVYKEVYEQLAGFFGTESTLKRVGERHGMTEYCALIRQELAYNRYLSVFVPTKVEEPVYMKLKDLKWVYLETSTKDAFLSVPNTANANDTFAQRKVIDYIHIVERNDVNSVYGAERYPINVTLIHDPKKKNSLQYPDSMPLHTALNTCRCFINFA